MAYRFNNKEKLLSFGEYPIVSLKDARTKRDEAKKLLADGIDPGRHKKEMKNAALLAEANTFEHVVLEWHDTQTVHNSEKDRERKPAQAGNLGKLFLADGVALFRQGL